MAPLKVSEKECKEENPLSLVWMKGLPSEKDGWDSSAGAGRSLTILQKTNSFADTDTSERQRSKN